MKNAKMHSSLHRLWKWVASLLRSEMTLRAEDTDQTGSGWCGQAHRWVPGGRENQTDCPQALPAGVPGQMGCFINANISRGQCSGEPPRWPTDTARSQAESRQRPPGSPAGSGSRKDTRLEKLKGLLLTAHPPHPSQPGRASARGAGSTAPSAAW